MKKNIVIFGSGTHSKVVFSEVIKLKKYNILGFVDDFSKKGKKILIHKKKAFFHLGSIKDFLKKSRGVHKNLCGIIGVGFNYNRKRVVDDVFKLDKNFKWESIISKDCTLNGNITIGEGSLIMSGVTINTETIIGSHCIINTSSSIDHDNNFKNFSSCGPGVITGGNVTIEESSYLGIGCVVKNKVKVGKNTVIGGNAFVNKKCLDSSLYYGVPAKRIKKRKIDENYL